MPTFHYLLCFHGPGTKIVKLSKAINLFPCTNMHFSHYTKHFACYTPIVIMLSSMINFAKKKLSLSYDYDTPFSPTKDRCDTNFMLSLSLFFHRWLLQNETSLAICFLARGASFLVKIFYINLDPTGGPQLLCEFFLH